MSAKELWWSFRDYVVEGPKTREGGRVFATYQRVLVPRDALLLVGIGVGEALDLAGLAAEETVQRRADLVALAVLQGVALGAPGLEEVGTLLGITWMESKNHVSNSVAGTAFKKEIGTHFVFAVPGCTAKKSAQVCLLLCFSRRCDNRELAGPGGL